MRTHSFAAFLVAFSLAASLLVPVCSAGQGAEETFTLTQTIETALEVNLDRAASQKDIDAAAALKKASRAAFLPSLSTSYEYVHAYEESRLAIFGVTSPENLHTFEATLTQPVFAGFALLNQYKLADLGLDTARFNERVVRRQIILRAQEIYFSLLKAQKLHKVARDTVTQIAAHTEVARNFYDVGMTPLNDYLQAQVELANASQGLVVAENSLELAKANYNNLLRRPLPAPVFIEDIRDYTPFDKDLADCQKAAGANRLEMKIADLQIEIAQKNVKLAQKDYFPAVNLTGTYYESGADWYLDGGEGISDPSGWYVAASATWTIWQWGGNYYGVKEKKDRLKQARIYKDSLVESIRLEVKGAYLKILESEKNILTIKKAIEQAEENYRINQERYKEQVATSTDVLDAQTLLSKTMTNYYNALYDFKIAKATLFWTMGREALP